ncbi:hypothetical protein AVEN_244735-1 [Araneus ventricosus]|uniref:Uncharacterized protein n=1 Tax=Araneus ventricosus TaxID=182803 RepID=A0A4Y2BST4_ARAVE|nr:hypothetical protein AVEN_244735-1 [Araneus ventricosus]
MAAGITVTLSRQITSGALPPAPPTPRDSMDGIPAAKFRKKIRLGKILFAKYFQWFLILITRQSKIRSTFSSSVANQWGGQGTFEGRVVHAGARVKDLILFSNVVVYSRLSRAND